MFMKLLFALLLMMIMLLYFCNFILEKGGICLKLP